MNLQIIIASDLFLDYLKITDLLNFLLLIFYIGILQVIRIDFLKFSILEILKFHPCFIQFTVTCLETADLLALVCGVQL